MTDPREAHGPRTVKELFKRYRESRPNVRSQSNITCHNTVIHRFGRFLGREARLSDLDEQTVGGYWRWRSEQVAPNTLNTEACNLLALWKWAALNGWRRPPLISAPPRVQKSPRSLTVEQLATLFDAAERTDLLVRSTVGNRFWPAFLHLAWETGERRSALLAVRWEDFDLENRRGAWVTFPARHRKGGGRDSVRPLSGDAVKRLRRLREVRPKSRAVFKFAAYAIDGYWRALRDEAGVPGWCTIHTLRRTHATHLHAAGGDASASLGHSRRDLVKRHYLDPRLSVNRDDLDRLPDIAGTGLLGRLFGKSEKGGRS